MKIENGIISNWNEEKGFGFITPKLGGKSLKLSFRITYWVTVVANCVALYGLITPKGSMWLKSVLKNINFG